MIILDNTAARIAFARCGKTVTECADEYGCSDNNYIYHLLAHKGPITWYTAGKIAKMLEVDVMDIIREVDDDDGRDNR